MQMSHLATDGASKIAYSLEPILNLAHLRQLLSNQAIDEASKLHVKHKLLLDSYFLEKGAKPFIGGDSASIADLLCAATLDQTKEAGADHAANTDYLERVKAAVSPEIYDQVTSDCRAIPSILREMKRLPAQ